VPFPTDWHPETRYLLIEAIVGPGKGRFGGTPRRDRDPDHHRMNCYSHSLIYLIDRKEGVISAAFTPDRVKGPRSYGGIEDIELIPGVNGIDLTGIEKLWWLLKVAHCGVRQKATGHVHAQDHYKPKHFCVTQLDEVQHRNVKLYIESYYTHQRYYQAMGYLAYNCDGFRRGARRAAGLPVSVLGLLFPFPKFRATAISIAAHSHKYGLNPSASRSFGASTTKSMLRRAYRTGALSLEKWVPHYAGVFVDPVSRTEAIEGFIVENTPVPPPTMLDAQQSAPSSFVVA
jgi:hypothetical protein